MFVNMASGFSGQNPQWKHSSALVNKQLLAVVLSPLAKQQQVAKTQLICFFVGLDLSDTIHHPLHPLMTKSACILCHFRNVDLIHMGCVLVPKPRKSDSET